MSRFTLDPDGYPSPETLHTITHWTRAQDYKELMTRIKEIWKYADGYWQDNGTAYELSTAGWSGNEDIIVALMDNVIFWATCWKASKRGGHYKFETTRS